MNYQVYFYDYSSDCERTVGIYTTPELAQELCEKINALQESKASIREIFVADTLPVIYTHRSYINFEDINRVDVEKLEFIQISDDFVQPVMSKPLLRPLVGVGALGINEEDALSSVKSKMVIAIQNGTYQHWQESISLKALAIETALKLAFKENIVMSDNYPLNYEDVEDWTKILQQCYKDVGLV